jgi:hypothetical protein
MSCCCRGQDTGSDGRARWQRTFSGSSEVGRQTNSGHACAVPRACRDIAVPRRKRLGRWRVSHGALRRRTGPEPPWPRRSSSACLTAAYLQGARWAPHRVRRFARKVPYSGTNPLALELDQRRADRAGKLLLIHPDAARLDGGPALESIQDAAKAQKSTTVRSSSGDPGLT